jgi:hypothetical protein
MSQLGAWFRQLPGALWGALAVGAVIAWVGQLLLTAGAVEVLRQRRTDRLRVWRATFDAGPRALLPYLRVAVLALLFLALGTVALDFVFDRLARHAKLAGWTGEAAHFVLPLARAAAWVAWASLVGSFAFWGRVILAADGRQRARRLLGIVPRLFWRRPVRALLAHAAVGVASLFGGASVLVAWGQSARIDAWYWAPPWAAALLAQSWIWHWRMRASLLIWEDNTLGDLRGVPDEPWHVFRRLRDRLRRRTGRVEPAAPSASEPPPLTEAPPPF